MNTEHLHRPVYLPELLANAFNQTPERPLLQLAGGPMLTVGQVRNTTSQFIQALQSLGVGPGTRVAVLSNGRPEVLHVAHAVQLLAAIAVPMFSRSGLDDHLRIVIEAPVDLLIFDADHFGERAAQLANEATGMSLVAFGASSIAEDLCQLAKRFEPSPLIAPRVDGSTIARISYSGGTTGKSKALITTQRSVLSAAQIMMAEWEWPNPPRALSCAPLSHAGSAMFLPTLLKQGTILVQPTFEPVAVMQAIQDYKINCMLVVPTMIYKLLNHPRCHEFDLRSLETVFYGTSPISPTLLKRAIERIGPVFFQFYGQSEAPMTITVLRKHEHDVNDPTRLASCGRPVPWLRVELFDTSLNRVADGEPGEICVQGPLVMGGYRDDQELNTETLRGDWLHTGDIAVRDPGGYLRIIGRTKDIIISGGFNIHPRAIEDVIAEHHAVSQVMVIGVPDPEWGEVVKALVVVRKGHSVTDEELIALVAKRRTFEAPKLVQFVDRIQTTATDRPDRKAARLLYGQSSG